MDEYTTDALVNRDDHHHSPVNPVNLKSKVVPKNVGNYVQDRFLTKVLEQVVPNDELDEGGSTGLANETPYTKKPAFSLPLMTANFRRFNSRIGIVFLFQNRVERLLSWRTPTHTLSFLIVYSFVCLEPYLLAVIPIAALLILVMVPAFIARHPPPPSMSTSSMVPYYSYHGPALAPPKTIEPASETSKDFFRNLRDLQNCMADFATTHDSIISILAPLTDFANEGLSSITFLLCTVAAFVLFMTAQLIPWRFVFLLVGNASIISLHPSMQLFVRGLKEDIAAYTSGQANPAASDEKAMPQGLQTPSPPSAGSFLGSALQITLDSYTEEREVEIFELQYRSLEPYSPAPHWEHFMFTPMPYDPLSANRIAGDRPKGCRFFEDVRPPPGWAWKDKTWVLDLDCREWVIERMIVGVGFDVSGHPAEGDDAADKLGGWVWDLPATPPSRDEEEPTLAYGDLKESKKGDNHHHHHRLTSKLRGKSKHAQRDWEEGNVGTHSMGEWRRRRWVRVVHRVPASHKNKYSNDHTC